MRPFGVMTLQQVAVPSVGRDWVTGSIVPFQFTRKEEMVLAVPATIRVPLGAKSAANGEGSGVELETGSESVPLGKTRKRSTLFVELSTTARNWPLGLNSMAVGEVEGPLRLCVECGMGWR